MQALTVAVLSQPRERDASHDWRGHVRQDDIGCCEKRKWGKFGASWQLPNQAVGMTCIAEKVMLFFGFDG